MRYKQVRFAPPGYTPRIHGYCRVSHKGQADKGNSIADQEKRIKQYIELRRLDSNDPDFQVAEFHKLWREPYAQSAYRHELRERPAGRKMILDLRPSDYIIVDKLDRIFRNTLDFLTCRRYFAEMGVGLHFVNFLGMSVDTGSTGGGMLVHMLAFMAEMESDRLGERVSLSRKERMAQGKHSGGAVPFYCKLEGGKAGKKAGSGGRLVFKPWALEAMKRVAAAKDSKKITFEMIGKHEGVYDYLSQFITVPADDRRHAAWILYRLYWFYKAWTHAGQPDINTIRLTEMIRNYRDGLERGSNGNDDGSDTTADTD